MFLRSARGDTIKKNQLSQKMVGCKVHVPASTSSRRGKGEREAILLLCELVRMRNDRSWQGRKGAELGGGEGAEWRRGRGGGGLKPEGTWSLGVAYETLVFPQ
jgi:hypothetical protein